MNDLKEAMSMINRGDKRGANKILVEYIKASPDSAAAWILLARTQADEAKQRRALHKALEIDPNNPEAKRALASLDLADLEEAAQPVRYLKQKAQRWYFKPEVKIIAFLFCLPAWTLIELDDPNSSVGVKVVAGILGLVVILAACVYLS